MKLIYWILIVLLILLIIIGYLEDWFNLQSILIIIISVVVGGYFGSKILNK